MFLRKIEGQKTDQHVDHDTGARLLTTPHEILQAHNLLYRIYFDEMGWAPDEGNPSGIRLQPYLKSGLLIDNYEPVSTWFGYFDGGRLVACIRACTPLNGKFEMEQYRELPALLHGAPAIEVTRLAIEKEYRLRSPALFELLRALCTFTIEKKIGLMFSAAPFPNPGQIYIKLGMRQAEEKPFKYCETDPNVVYLVVGDFRDAVAVERAIDMCTQVIERLKGLKSRDG